MFRLSNLVTALFGVIAALGTILGIGSISSANKTAKTSPSGDAITTEQLSPDLLDPTIATPSARDGLALSSSRQIGSTLPNQEGTAPTAAEATAGDSTARTTGQNPSAPFIVQGEGAVLEAEPAPPTTPSEATAVQLDPSPGATVSAAPTSSQSAVQPVSEPAAPPAPRTVPVRAMW